MVKKIWIRGIHVHITARAIAVSGAAGYRHGGDRSPAPRPCAARARSRGPRGARAGAGRGHRPDEEDKCEKHGGGSTETDIARCESPLVDPAASSARIASVPLQ